MAPSTDPVATIKELYEEDTRRVPYPVFMRCFDQLLADPPSHEPAMPSEELKEPFRAVCMAIDLGIADGQARDADRRKEFYEHILPAWEEFLPPVELRACQEILEGKIREQMEEERRKEQLKEGQERRRREDEMAGEATRERSSRLANALDAAVRATTKGDEARQKAAEEAAEETVDDASPPAESAGSAPETTGTTPPEGTEEPPAAAPEPADEQPTTAEDKGKKKTRIPVAGTVATLCRAFATGRLPISYSSPRDRKPIAQYKFRGRKVAVRLMQKGGGCYVVLGFGRSLREIPGIKQKARILAEELGYEPSNTWTFQKAVDGAAHQVRLGENSTYLICRRSQKFGAEELARKILRLHEDLLHLLRGLPDA